MRLTIISLLVCCLTFTACQRSPRSSAAPEEILAAERSSYEDMVQARLNEFDHRFDGLEARMKGLSRADQEKLRMDTLELRARKDLLDQKLEDLKKVSNESWRDLKNSIDESLDRLEMAYNVVAANSPGATH